MQDSSKLKALNKIIDECIFYKDKKEKDGGDKKIWISMETMGMKYEENEWLEAMRFVHYLRKQKNCFKRVSSDRNHFIFIEPDIKKLVQFKNDFESEIVKYAKDDFKLIEYIYHKDEGKLRIMDYKVISFVGYRAKIIEVLYNAPDRKKWQSYKELASKIGWQKKEFLFNDIKKAISKINQRVRNSTDGDFEIIEMKKVEGDSFNSPNQFRWKH